MRLRIFCIAVACIAGEMLLRGIFRITGLKWRVLLLFFYLNFREVLKLWAVPEIHLRMEGVTNSWSEIYIA